MIQMNGGATDGAQCNQQPQPVVETGSTSHNMRPPMRSGALTEMMEEFSRARLVLIYTFAFIISVLLVRLFCVQFKVLINSLALWEDIMKFENEYDLVDAINFRNHKKTGWQSMIIFLLTKVIKKSS